MRDLSEFKLPVSEIYYCLQGEGPFLGIPSILVRTEGCNLRCKFCDTKYAAYGMKKRVKPMSSFGIMNSIRTLSSENITNNIILTGGEPLVHKDSEQFIRRLLSEGYHVTVETNGTVPLSKSFLRILPRFKGKIYFAVSPKLKSSGFRSGRNSIRHNTLRINFKALETFSSNGEFSFFKFVVKSKKDTPEIFTLQCKLGIPNSDMFLMPEGQTRREIQKTRKITYELCLEFGLRYSPRLQVDIYGTKRKV